MNDLQHWHHERQKEMDSVIQNGKTQWEFQRESFKKSAVAVDLTSLQVECILARLKFAFNQGFNVGQSVAAQSLFAVPLGHHITNDGE